MKNSLSRYEQLTAETWDEAAVRNEIQKIAGATELAYSSQFWWPHHPRDDQQPTDAPNTTLYLGATGVMWALEFLTSKQIVTLSRSYSDLWQKAYENYLSLPDTGTDVPSWFLGSSFPLLMCMLRGKVQERDAAAEALAAAISSNQDNPTWELLWGSPGTMLAAIAAFEQTGDRRWAELYLRSADRLWHEWIFDESLDCYLWTQDLYGKTRVLYGAGHGFIGNAFALLRGQNLLSAQKKSQLIQRVITTTKNIAATDNGRANGHFPTVKPDPGTDSGLPLVQWCHGAPGFIMSLAQQVPIGLDEEFDTLLLRAGEQVWQSGPLAKGACFCHGTDGNGMALVSLFARTGDQQWLDRARQFAVHAIEQSHRNLQRYGMHRFTLWTGDLGLAVFLEACISGKPHMPTLDFV